MRTGFVFDHTLCVNCKACSAACIMENSFEVKPRSIVTNNSEASVYLPLINLSIACNHCEIPACLNGCPASAYLRDPSSGAVILDDKKCIGCKYCIWNCPYDAPKYNQRKQIVDKCHLCYSMLESGMIPACAQGCPTGALSYDSIDESDSSYYPVWFPGMELNPATRFKCSFTDTPLRIVPAKMFKKEMKSIFQESSSLKSEWSLIMFSFMIILSVSVIISSVLNGILPGKVLFLSLTLFPGLFSIFHLGKGLRAWRALTNLKRSPLSREILLYLIYVSVSSVAIIKELPWLLVSSSVAGILLLIAIDSVYIYSVKSLRFCLHSGQTLITSLLVVSFLSGNILPFLFIALIKIAILVYAAILNHGSRNKSVLRFVRMALLIVAGSGFISGISSPEPPVVILLIAGEFIDRIMFYIDFEPNSLSLLMNNHLAEMKHEKEKY